MLITIGSVTGVSIAALFTGGLLPALVLALALAFDRPLAGPQREHGRRAPAALEQDRQARFVVALPALVLPFVIRTAVIEGIATATEVSTIGIVYAAVVGIAGLSPVPAGAGCIRCWWRPRRCRARSC